MDADKGVALDRFFDSLDRQASVIEELIAFFTQSIPNLERIIELQQEHGQHELTSLYHQGLRLLDLQEPGDEDPRLYDGVYMIWLAIDPPRP